MNKEEIEKAKQCLNEIIQNTYAEGKAKKLDILRKYIKELEQKESILDKVTEFIKDDVTAEDIKFEGSKITHFIYKNLINMTKEIKSILKKDLKKYQSLVNVTEGETQDIYMEVVMFFQELLDE